MDFTCDSYCEKICGKTHQKKGILYFRDRERFDNIVIKHDKKIEFSEFISQITEVF